MKGDGLVFKTLERHPLVLEYDNHGTDEGRFLLTLIPGYAFEDAVTERGGCCRSTSHTRSFGSAKEAVEFIKLLAEPCVCERCVS